LNESCEESKTPLVVRQARSARVGEVETRFYAQIGAAREGEPVLIDLARSSQSPREGSQSRVQASWRLDAGRPRLPFLPHPPDKESARLAE
jgi:hypothetical protein